MQIRLPISFTGTFDWLGLQKSEMHGLELRILIITFTISVTHAISVMDEIHKGIFICNL